MPIFIRDLAALISMTFFIASIAMLSEAMRLIG
jgi:hypothetical protein